MISNRQFRKYILRPTLEPLNLWSENAEEILVATMAHESLGGTYVVQENKDCQRVMKGGIGIYQIEPETYNAVSVRYSVKFPELASRKPDDMIHDWGFATLVARLNYMRFKEPLPEANDIDGIWLYYKAKWNSYEGKATKEDFVRNYKNFTSRRV